MSIILVLSMSDCDSSEFSGSIYEYAYYCLLKQSKVFLALISIELLILFYLVCKLSGNYLSKSLAYISSHFKISEEIAISFKSHTSTIA